MRMNLRVAALLLAAVVPAGASPASLAVLPGSVDAAAARRSLLDWGDGPTRRRVSREEVTRRIIGVVGLEDAKGTQVWGDDFGQPKPSGAFQKLLDKIEKEGEVGLDPQTGLLLKGLPAAVDEIPNGQALTMVVMTGAPTETGGFKAEAVLAILASQQRTRQALSEKSVRIETTESQTLLQADMAGKVARGVSTKAVKAGVTSVEEAGATDATRKDFAAELAAAQKAVGVGTVKALVAKVRNDGQFGEKDADGPARFLLPLPVEEVDGGVRGRLIAVVGEGGGDSFTPKALMLISKVQKGETAQDQKSEKTQMTLRTFTASLDGKLEGVVTAKVDQTVTVEGGELKADAQSQKLFDGAVARMLR
ncbi:MAG: hypothetical protein HY927_09505 [Elusimicrobia bacterium]|nr:hypothetical protein [Elusimicrobiota bacterium]